MSAVWQPAAEGISQIVNLLQMLSDPAQAAQHAEGNRTLMQYGSTPEFCLYLSHLLAYPALGVPAAVRQLCGLVLKGQIRQAFPGLAADLQNIVRENALLALKDPDSTVRTTAGTVIAAITTQRGCGGLGGWPQLMPTLATMLNSNEQHQAEGAFDALHKIFEDGLGTTLDLRTLAATLRALIPQFIRYMRAVDGSAPPGAMPGATGPGVFVGASAGATEKLQYQAVRCMNKLGVLVPGAVLGVSQEFLSCLADLGQSPNASIRRAVCQGLTMMLDSNLDAMWRMLPGVFKFMMLSLQDHDETVALEAGEFWMSIFNTAALEAVIGLQVVPQLTQVLLKRMAYSADEIAEFQSEDPNNENEPDRVEDIRPMFRKNKGDDDDNDTVDAWTVRKCCAATMDTMAGVIDPTQLLPVLLPHLQAGFNSSNVWEREAALLCLGAICNGCGEAIEEHLPALVPFLIAQAADAVPQVRLMACWCISRYSEWILQQEIEQDFLVPALNRLLERVMDSNKKVQEAACSAIATLEGNAGDELVPYLESMIKTFVAASHKYQVRSSVILYDAIGTLADVVGQHIADPYLLSILMPPLLQKWSTVIPADRHMFSLLECLTSVCNALGPSIKDYAAPLFTRCVVLIETCIVQAAAAELGSSAPENTGTLSLSAADDNQFLVCTLDLTSAVLENIGKIESVGTAAAEHLIGSCNLLALIRECLKLKDNDVSQSALALIGEISKVAITTLVPVMTVMMPMMIEAVNPSHRSVATNASWAIGEISSRIGQDMCRWCAPLMPKMLILLQVDPYGVQAGDEPDEYEDEPRQLTNSGMIENAAITVARLAVACPDIMASQLAVYCGDWCRATAFVRSNEDRSVVFRALLLLLQRNPDALLQSTENIAQFALAVTGWTALRSVWVHDAYPEKGGAQLDNGCLWIPPQLPGDLAGLCARFLLAIRDSRQQQWAAMTAQLPRDSHTLLHRFLTS